jgi:hypothetical protein
MTSLAAGVPRVFMTVDTAFITVVTAFMSTITTLIFSILFLPRRAEFSDGGNGVLKKVGAPRLETRQR